MWFIVLFIAVLLCDQLTKILIASWSGVAGTLGSGDTVTLKVLIKNFLQIDYCENTNGAMGLFKNLPHSQTVFIVVTIVILIGLLIYLCVSKHRSKWLNTSLALITAGAIGNFIDRLTTHYVRDFIHVIIKIGGAERFPYIFNVADMALCIGAVMLVIYLVFLDKDALFKKKKKEPEKEAVKTQNAE